MNWDKQSIVAVVVGGAVLVWWYAFGINMFNKPAAPAPTPAAVAEQSQNQQQAVKTAVKVEKTVPVKEMAPVVISGDETSYTIQPVTGAVKKISFDKKLQKNAKGETLELINENQQNSWLGTFGTSTAVGALKTLKVTPDMWDESIIELK